MKRVLHPRSREPKTGESHSCDPAIRHVWKHLELLFGEAEPMAERVMIEEHQDQEHGEQPYQIQVRVTKNFTVSI